MTASCGSGTPVNGVPYCTGAPSPTVIFTVQFLEANDMGKDAVPLEEGVPDKVKTRLPEPLASTPACRVAVSPVTPVEPIAAPAAYDNPLPFE